MTFQSAKRFAKDLAKRNPKRFPKRNPRRFPKSQYAKWQTYKPISVWAGTTSLPIASKGISTPVGLPTTDIFIYLYNGYCYGETKVIETLHLKRNQESQSSRFIKEYKKVVPPGCLQNARRSLCNTL